MGKCHQKEVGISVKKLLKLLCLNVGIAIVDVILFSQGLVGLTIGANALISALAVTAIIMSAVVFSYGNYRILLAQPERPRLYRKTELNDPKSYIAALDERRDKKVFEKDIAAAVEQIYRIEDKQQALSTILAQYFTPQEMTYTKFQGTINAVMATFYDNIKKMLNRITIFDYKDYVKLNDKIRYSPQINGMGVASVSVGEQIKIYNEHIAYVSGLVETNDRILTKLDALLLEITKLDDPNESDLENTLAIQEINELIQQTKYYKT